jgi:hypothetical protein
MEGDGFFDLITMAAFCREKAAELLIQRGLKVDELSRQKILARPSAAAAGMAEDDGTRLI